tara:strand:+ start:2293 stop:3678 length:1386 start_codon:yes stop_codon:yes gene_type:complete
MAVKFSQFTEETVASNITRIVGYTASGNINVQIPPANLDTTYSFATTQDGNNVDLTLTGTKTGSSSTTEVLQFTAGSGITLTAGTDEITIDAAGAVTSVDETTPGTSSGTPIVVNPTSGTVLVQSMAYAGTTNVGHVPTGGSGTTFLRGDGTWATPAGGFTSFDISGDTGTETVNSGDTITFAGGTNVTTAVTATDTVTINVSGDIWTLAGDQGTNQAISVGNTATIKENTTVVVNSVQVGGGVITTGTATDQLLLDQASEMTVTVVNPGSGNQLYIDGAYQASINLTPGFTYEFNQDAATNDGHPLEIGEVLDGSTPYATGIQYYGSTSANTLTAVSQADYSNTTNFNSYATRRVRLRITQNSPTLYYYCSIHSGMGGNISYGGGAGVTKTVDSFSISNASTNSITVTSATDPTSKDYIDVYINGVYQAKANFSALSGKTLTLAAGNFPNGSTVEAVTTT